MHLGTPTIVLDENRRRLSCDNGRDRIFHGDTKIQKNITNDRIVEVLLGPFQI